MQTVLSFHYLPCIPWFAQLLNGSDVVLDAHEHFIKQTFRNRCVILTANGPLPLTIPVKHASSHMPMHSVQIENDFPWQKQHWEAIRSAYGSSPYFDHYGPHFEPFYTSPFEHLAVFHSQMLGTCLKLMKVQPTWTESDAYVKPGSVRNDLRELIHPKRPMEISGKPYLQVFSAKFGFVPNLSIMDLLFNQGPYWNDLLPRIS